MAQAFFLLCLLLAPMVLAFSATDRRDKVLCTSAIFIMGIIFMMVLFYIDQDIPYGEGGDDVRYYKSSLAVLENLADWFDFTRIRQYAEQPGYGLLLTWVGQIVDDSLLLRKALNLSFFLCLPSIWYSIGMSIKGRVLANSAFWMILATSPLWFFWMFLLKDMTIVLLQSIFLIAAINLFSGKKSISSAVLIFISTVLLIPFRVYLVAINVGLLGAGFFLTLKSRTGAGTKFIRLIIVSVFAIAILVLATSKSALNSLGVDSETRSMNTEVLKKNSELYQKAKGSQLRQQAMYTIKFPILFIIGETAGLNPQSWNNIVGESIRGFLAVPWIFFGAPLFLIGIYAYVRPRRPKSAPRLSYAVNGGTAIAAAGQRTVINQYATLNRALASLIFVFILAYFAIAWFSTDTTRWRMPAMPAMSLIAALGWISIQPKLRTVLLVSWVSLICLFALAYYLMQ